ncbi:MAG: zinc import ATP-binding protein ZnuC [Candidatus Xenolissoclinum pacificiensis L6]|uniref:Zinc import ATP-binding protein ZnuC n=1 Tax=Candidatus Xenolissoclinum pacificiensis L6 TaxID=1401685 RepID=W2UZE2_9RICK|nr:MAG: zinc import ATP-binding protein ZnuC [Candidatus Xenolissoclinum pacificiensis L6]
MLKDNIVLELKNIKFHNDILEDINVIVKKNHFIVIIGPNGGGKSTLLKIIGGLYKIHSGVRLQQPGIKFGYIPQSIYLNKYLPITVLDFLKTTTSKKEFSQKVSQIVERTYIGNLLTQSIHRISGGEMQLVLLARCLIQDYNVLLMDEPFSNLDVYHKQKVHNILEMVRKQLTIVMTSHDLHLVLDQPNHVICLNKKIIVQGSPQKVIHSTGFKSLFGNNTYFYQNDHKNNS